MRHTDTKSMRRFTDTVGSRVQALEDDHLITNTDRVTTAAPDGACNTLLVKPN